MLFKRGFLFVLFTYSIAVGQVAPVDVLKLCQAAINSHTNIKYQVVSRVLTVGAVDTQTMCIDVVLRKGEPLVLKFPVPAGTHIEAMEDTSVMIYSVSYKAKTIKSLNLPGKDKLPHSTQAAVHLFHREGVYNERMVSVADMKLLPDADSCHVVQILYPDMDMVRNSRIMVYIHQRDHMPRRYTQEMTVNNETIYSDYTFSSYHFDNEPLFDKAKYSDFKFTSVDVSDIPEKPYKNIGKPLAPVSAVRIGDFKQNAVDFKGKVTVVDFWYMACAGCIMSYPVIDSVRAAYAHNNDVAVIGFNGVDTDQRKREKLMQYVSNHKITYPSYLLEKKDFDSVFEGSAPLFLVIDKRGVVRYSTVGYHAGLYNELLMQVVILLNEQ